jgi:multimeric flavodoxin WrbA
MTEPVLTKEGQRTLDSILNTRAPITRQEWKKRILRILSLLMNEQGCQEAGSELVIEAAEMTLGKASGPILYRMRDPNGFKKQFLERYYNLEAYYAGPYEVKRWDTMPSKPAKRPDRMKVIAFCASPRKGGNTDVLVDEALRGAKDSGAKGEKIMLQKLNLRFCIGCRKCKEPGFERICAQKDDMTDIYQKIKDSDAIIIGFPIYTWRECAQLATFLDRWDCFSKPKPAITSANVLTKEQGGKKFEYELPIFSPLLEPPRRALVIGTWGYANVDTYEDVMERIMTTLNQHNIETVEAISACGFVGMLRGLDDKGKAIITRFPNELEKAYQAGKSLVTG